MLKESVHCNICEKELETINSSEMHDRKNQFGIKRHDHDPPGELQIVSLKGMKLHDARCCQDHTCSYAHLQRYFVNMVAPEVKKERKASK